jgi:hypothetical protein
MPSALISYSGDEKGTLMAFAMQGPLTAAGSCAGALRDKPANTVAFFFDDLVYKNGLPERRLRLRVQRRQDAEAAVFDQYYEPPAPGKPFTVRGGLLFNRWSSSLLPVGTSPAPTPLPSKPAVILDQRTIIRPPSSFGVPKVTFSTPGMTIDKLAGLLGHVARRLAVTAVGLEVAYLDGRTASVTWADVRELWARRLPNERPWESHPVLEIALEREGQRQVARVFATTAVTLTESLPPTRQEILRRIAILVAQNAPHATVDAATRQFSEGRGAPAALQVIDELMARNG